MSTQTRKARVIFPHKLLILSIVFFGLCVFFLLVPNRVSTQATETCVQPPPGIIAWWPFDETSGTTAEEVIGGRNGVHINGPVPTPGKVGGALRFNGSSSYVGAPDSDLWAFGTGNFTVELWANFDAPTSGDIVHPGDVFISSDDGPGTQNKWIFALGGGLLELIVVNTADVPPNFFLVRAPFSPVVGEWYHLAVTKTATLFTIYVDGVEVGSEVSTPPIANANAPLIIGQSNEPFGGFMNGLLDEVTIYNRALTQTELKAIFDAGSAGKCKALSISTKALSAVQLGAFSTQTLEASSGRAPFNWSLVNGDLPSGMSLSSDGVLSGTPTVAGSFPVTIKVTDSQHQIAQKDFTLNILLIPPQPQLRITKAGTVAVPGRTMEYFIVVENVGGSSATNIVVTALIEPWFDLLSVTPAASLITKAPDAFPFDVMQSEYDAFVNWDLSTLSPGEIRVLSYQVKLDSHVPLGTAVTGAGCLNVVARAENCQREFNVCTNNCTIACLITRVPQACLACEAVCVANYLRCLNGADVLCGLRELLATGPVDPNEKLVTAPRFIQPDELLVYPTHFENIGNAEARDVFVTDVLDPNLDASTLTLLTPNGGSFDVATRTVKWGLLNRNLEPGETGNVLLSVRPRPGLPSGTVIRNSATIQFEVFQPIVTNEVVNVIDSSRPTSLMNSLPAETSTLDFPISWSGSDAIGEIDFYSIFVSVDGAPFTPFLDRTRETSANFRGEVGKTYGFLAIATDTAGNIEVQAANAEASTRIVSHCATGGDNQPPTITGESASPTTLWPPNHRMQDIAVDYTAADNCPFTCTLSVRSNEPVNGTGDGDTEPDWAVVNAHHVRLRAERTGTGSGRFYTITITCTDGSGNSTSKDVAVFVAHNIVSPASGVVFKIGPAVNFTGTFWEKLVSVVAWARSDSLYGR
jgi:uncharacterized repeat protein (TIGR01451 family)